MPKKKPEMVKERVLMLISIEHPADEFDEVDPDWNSMDEIVDGLMSVDTEKAITESLGTWYSTDAEVSVLHAQAVEPPADKRMRPQFKLTRSGGLIQTV